MSRTEFRRGAKVNQLSADLAERPSVVPALGGVPETLLWTLYARACEARRPGGVLRDPEAIRICDSIDYDFTGRFGRPEPLFALRAALIDDALRSWLRTHPDGVVVSLGEGLETQSYRVDNGRMRWISLDVPDAMRLRDLFMPAGGRFEHLATSATDPGWMDGLDPSQPTLIVAQGLFMYFEEAVVRRMLADIASRLPGATLIFDTVNRTFVDGTQLGHHQTAAYRLPQMQWGVDRNRLAGTLRHWRVGVRTITFLPYRQVTRYPAVIESLLDRIVPQRGRLNSLVQVTFR